MKDDRFENIRALIERADDLDTLLFVLNDLCDESMTLLGRETPPVEELNSLISLLEDLRNLICDLKMSDKYKSDERRSLAMQHIIERLLDTENEAVRVIRQMGPIT